MKILNLLPKTGTSGSLHLEWKRCGRSHCRCVKGMKHGPYVYLHSYAAGKQRKTYVPMKMLAQVMLRLEQTRMASPTAADLHLLAKTIAPWP